MIFSCFFCNKQLYLRASVFGHYPEESYIKVVLHMETKEKFYIQPQGKEIEILMEGCIAQTGGGPGEGGSEGEEGGEDIP